MSDDRVHARLSPSGAHGWMACPAWGSDSTGSKYADEGTAAHTLAAWCLTEERPARAYLGRVIPAGKHEFTVDESMADHIQRYVDQILSYCGSFTPAGGFIRVHHLLVEQAVPIGHVTGEDGAEGTSDAIILTKDGEEVQTHDLKFGQGERVDAENNPQLMLYALGALVVAALLGWTPKRVRCVIHQPRLDHLSEWTCTVDELQAFAKRVDQCADEIHHGQAIAVPGEKQCRWCARKATCPALALFVQETIGADFEEIVAGSRNIDPDFAHSIHAQMNAVNLIEDWCRAVRAETERRLFAGDEVEGYKLVEGKRGARAWVDEKQAEALFKSMRLKQEEMYNSKLISPTQAEKLLKDTPKRWARLDGQISQSQGKPSVVPVSDKRPALAINKVEDDFEVITEETTA